jgi:hypothetical protein
VTVNETTPPTLAPPAVPGGYMDPYSPLPVDTAMPATGIRVDDPDAELPHGEEPVATGTLFIMILFLMLTGGLWGIVYIMLLNR